MDIGGAALYSLLLMAARGLSHLAFRACRVLARAGHCLIEGMALYGADFYPMPPTSDQQADKEHSAGEQP
jgi:hypothetical protein